jgi:hypothetical protein
MGYSNVEALIAQIRSDFSKYSDASLIDQTSLYRDISLGLKRFGNDIMQLQETVVEVKNGYAELPQSFYSLYLAYLCNPKGYVKNSVEQEDLQNSIFYKEKIVKSNTWNECDASCVTITENIVKESIILNSGKIDLIYDNPTLLRLGKTFKKDNCHKACRNRLVVDNPNEIVILNYRLQANFNEGFIYLQYYGLPTDDEGNIDVPDTPNGSIETYLEYYLKRRLAERLMGNNDAQGIQNLYGVYKQEERVALVNATNELKMTNITPRIGKRIKRLNSIEALQYESKLTW